MYSKIAGNKISQLLEIIDRNRWEQIRRLTDPVYAYAPAIETGQELSASDVQIVLFGADTPFSDSVVSMFSKETVITSFNDPEKAINFCCNHSIQNIILDIDPPSDYHHALDVFNALKILNHAMQFFICSKHHNSIERGYFEIQDTVIFTKPILKRQVMWIVNHLRQVQQ